MTDELKAGTKPLKCNRGSDPSRRNISAESFLAWWPRFLTPRLADHDVAVFALPAAIVALHLDVVGGLRLQVRDHVPVLYTWKPQK